MKGRQANVVRYNITATVDVVNDPRNLLGGSIQVGDLLTSVLQYDLSLPDSEPMDTNVGLYDATPPGHDNFLEGAADGNPFFETIDCLFVDVQNDSFGQDYIGFYAGGDSTPPMLSHPDVD